MAARLPIIRCALRALPVPRHRLISARFARHVKRIGAAFGDDEASRAAATLAVQIGIGFGERRCDHERSAVIRDGTGNCREALQTHSLVMANRRVGDHGARRRHCAAISQRTCVRYPRGENNTVRGQGHYLVEALHNEWGN